MRMKSLFKGLDSIDDMESITEGPEGNIYIACSQSSASNGSPADERKLLVRLTRERTLVRLDKKIYLYDLLMQAAEKEKDLPWAQFLVSGDDTKEINIEGIFSDKDSLSLGFLRPFKGPNSVILRIADINKVFETGSLGPQQVELWQEVDLRDDRTGIPTGISDLYLHNTHLYILSYVKSKKDGKKNKIGNLWRYDIINNKLLHIMSLEDLKPEGITFNHHTNEFVITFDNGKKKPSKIMKFQD